MEINGDEKASVVTKNVTITFSDSSKIISQISAPIRKDYLSENSFSDFTEGITLILYDNTQLPATTLKANYGRIWQKTGMLTVKGNVELTSKNGGRLLTEELIWDNKSKMIKTGKPIQIIDNKRMLTGQGLIADEKFENYQILLPTGVITIAE
jgi:LPS export ABC transporter protein LptC